MSPFHDPGQAPADARSGWLQVNAFRIFLLALLVRIGFALWLPDGILWPDGQRYVKIAESLIAGNGFGSLEMNKIAVPTQPVLIGLFLVMFDHSYTAARIGFGLIGALSCVLACRLGTVLFDRKVGAIAGLLLSVYPLHAYASALFEIPQGFFILAVGSGFLALFEFVRTRKGRWLTVGGAALGVAGLSVPTVLPYFAGLFIWLAVLEQRPLRWFRNVALLLIGAMAAMAPWVVRNYLAYDRFVLVNAAGGENFWKANSGTYQEQGKRAAVLPCENGAENNQYCRDLMEVQDVAASHNLNEIDTILLADRMAWQKGAAYIREDPRRFLELSFKKLVALFDPRPDPVSQSAPDRSGLQSIVSVATYLPILMLGSIGMMLSLPRWRHLFPVYAYMLTLTVLYSIFLPTMRYRLPIDFFLIIFAAQSLMRGRGYLTQRKAQPIGMG